MREPSVHPHWKGAHCSLPVQVPAGEVFVPLSGVLDGVGVGAESPPPNVPDQPPWWNVVHADPHCAAAPWQVPCEHMRLLTIAPSVHLQK